MRAIFISYRRDDSEGEAGRLFDDLVEDFGESSVFMDVATIEAGRDFRKVIDERVATCGVLLAIIGKNWVDTKNEAGERRLDDPSDFVRLETASALKRDIPVIPVLVRGARMPRPEQLPEDLRDLAYRNGRELTHARWNSDLRLLITDLRIHVGDPDDHPKAGNIESVKPPLSAPQPPIPDPVNNRINWWQNQRKAILIGTILLGLIAAGAALYWLTRPPSPARPSIQQFAADQTKIERGGSVTFTWKVSSADGIVLEPEGRHFTGPAGSFAVAPRETSDYTLIATNNKSGEQDSRTIRIEILPQTNSNSSPTSPPQPVPARPVIDLFEATPTTVKQGGAVTLRWHVSNADEVILLTFGSEPRSGSTTAYPTGNAVYTLEATNRNGTVNKTRKVAVIPPAPAPLIAPPVITTFTVTPSQISSGDPITISWQVSNAESVRLDPPVDAAVSGPTGNIRVKGPPHSTKYFLHARNGAGTAESVQVVRVNVAPLTTQSVRVTISDASCSQIGPGRFQILMEGTINVPAGLTYLFYAEASNKSGGTRWRPSCKSWSAALPSDGGLWNVSCVHRPNDPAETAWGTKNIVTLANGPPRTVYVGTISNGRKTGGTDRTLSNCP